MFENEYTLNHSLIKEYVLKVIGKKSIFMSIFLVVLGLIMYFVSNDYLKYSMLVCSFIGLFCAIGIPIALIKNIESSAKRLNNGKIEKTRVVFNDNITMDEGKVHLEFEYSQIEKVTETDNFVVLIIGKNASILVFKDGFTKGTKEEFTIFINNKINN